MGQSTEYSRAIASQPSTEVSDVIFAFPVRATLDLARSACEDLTVTPNEGNLLSSS